MTNTLRAVIVCSAALGCCGMLAALPGTTREAYWNRGQTDRTDSKGQDAELNARLEMGQKRLAFKFTIVAALMEYRITLDEAAEAFLALNRSEPLLVLQMRRAFPAPSDEESAALQVLAYVRAQLRWSAGSTDSLMVELNDQLAQMRLGAANL